MEHCKIAELLHYFQDLASLLCQASKDGGYINPANVEEILGVPWTHKKTLGISPDEGSVFKFFIIFDIKFYLLKGKLGLYLAKKPTLTMTHRECLRSKFE